MAESDFRTTDYRLATWLLMQEGAALADIVTTMRRSGRPSSTFVIDLSACRQPLVALLQTYTSGTAMVVVQEWEATRRELLDNMFASHAQARKEREENAGGH